MNTKKLVGQINCQGCDTDENFLNSPDSAVTAMKSQSALIPLSVSAGSAGADVMPLSNDNLHISYAEKVDRCRVDCKNSQKDGASKKVPLGGNRPSQYASTI